MVSLDRCQSTGTTKKTEVLQTDMKHHAASLRQQSFFCKTPLIHIEIARTEIQSMIFASLEVAICFKIYQLTLDLLIETTGFLHNIFID